MVSSGILQSSEPRLPLECEAGLNQVSKLCASQLCLKKSSPATIFYYSILFLSLNKSFYSLEHSDTFIEHIFDIALVSDYSAG